jgi:hypothetical protein
VPHPPRLSRVSSQRGSRTFSEVNHPPTHLVLCSCTIRLSLSTMSVGQIQIIVIITIEMETRTSTIAITDRNHFTLDITAAASLADQRRSPASRRRRVNETAAGIGSFSLRHDHNISSKMLWDCHISVDPSLLFHSLFHLVVVS